MKYLVLLLIASVLYAGNLQRNSNFGVVIDSEQKLMWIDNKDTVKLQLSHKDAVPYCENLDYAQFTNWRIPTAEEYETIVDKNNTKTYINKTFKYNVPTGYWALKSHVRTFWFYADYMNFISGTVYYDNRNKKKFIRCVRDIE